MMDRVADVEERKIIREVGESRGGHWAGIFECHQSLSDGDRHFGDRQALVTPSR